jgi:hypothetical protein
MDLYILISTEKSNKKFYILLKKLYNDINKLEYTIRKLNKFRNLLNKKLREIYEKNDFTNEIIISLIFDLIKKSYYLQGKEKNLMNSSFNVDIKTGKKIIAKMLNKSNVKIDISDISNNTNNSSNDSRVNYSEEFESIIEEECFILEESLNLAFKFLELTKKNELNYIENNNDNKINNINNKEILLMMNDFKPEEKTKKNEKDSYSYTYSNNNNNNIINYLNFKQNEISINCINFIHKFMENPLKYINKNQIQTTVNFI